MKVLETIAIISWIISSTVYFILIMTAKNILAKLGYKVTIMNPSISDYQRLKKHRFENKKINLIYKTLLISTYAVIVCILIIIFSIFL